ncbi:LysR family transcriptional regulator [Zavarzinia compransoris]|uniref:LysR family transcriptional regulator n=1 Tax=Zavarzinia compransoris TaxID=1264899 RepID=A0A317E838_9PROT|nr:LysR family transcriptional regulator [Zavarzinia compransoris]PWR22416.1 LysR family transcriptional regulator [Zavarzinia compransoris]TDP45353.1 LysR family transcriptional regulator [Zavarzinia compransoris]
MNNRAGEMEVFAEVVAQGSFAAAGRRLGLTASAVSKLVARTEARLATRLLVRTTRALRLTPEGELYHQRAAAILAEIDETERLLAAGGAVVPRGLLRVNATVPFGSRMVLPLVPDFLALYPQVQLDLTLTDSMTDVVGERTDVAIRTGPLRDSGLKARKIHETPKVIAASPGYLAHHGVPLRPRDLARHNCIGFTFNSELADWPFRDGETVRVGGNCRVNNGETARRLALDGVGIIRVGHFHVAADFAAGRLVRLLAGHQAADDIEAINAVFAGHRHLASRIRAFLDFLAARIAPVTG